MYNSMWESLLGEKHELDGRGTERESECAMKGVSARVSGSEPILCLGGAT